MVYSLLISALLVVGSAATPLTLRHHKPGSGGSSSGSSSQCPANPLVSCQDTDPAESCCVETPGGMLLQTQFWDTKPSTGPHDSWTVHGLWNDNCDGTYQKNCDPSRAYSSISQVLQDNGKGDLVDWMNQYWVDINGDNEKFWAHEWSTHGTCYSTIAPACLGSSATNGEDAAYFFQKTIDTFKSLDTYQFLSQAGILPDSSKTYDLDELSSAIQASYGFIPALDCNGEYLNMISYYMSLQGTIIDGTMVPFDAPKAGSCKSSGIKYVPKTN